jgi:hypothetical protein
MERHDAWNDANFRVPPEHVPRLCEAIEALFPWSLIVRKPELVGYRLGDDLHRAARYLRPTPAARTLYAVRERVRREHDELDEAQAWIRLGLLGPLRNTLEMQALDPAWTPVR